MRLDLHILTDWDGKKKEILSVLSLLMLVFVMLLLWLLFWGVVNPPRGLFGLVCFSNDGRGGTGGGADHRSKIRRGWGREETDYIPNWLALNHSHHRNDSESAMGSGETILISFVIWGGQSRKDHVPAKPQLLKSLRRAPRPKPEEWSNRGPSACCLWTPWTRGEWHWHCGRSMALPLGGQTGLPCPEALLYEACSPSVSTDEHAHHVFTDEACSPCLYWRGMLTMSRGSPLRLSSAGDHDTLPDWVWRGLNSALIGLRPQW